MSRVTILLLLLGVAPSWALDWDPAGPVTAMGADGKANAEGTIPEWTGGIRKPPADYQPGGPHPDPFAADPVLSTITPENADQYKDKLSEGHRALLKKYPTYRMNVYPSRRSASLPDRVYEATRANAKAAELTEGGNGVRNAAVGVPFPIPKNGAEAIWNHLLRYRGDSVRRRTQQAPVTAGGQYTLLSLVEEAYFPYAAGDTSEATGNILVYLKQRFTAPARLAGTQLLVHETIDKVKEPRHSWLYTPGTRRVSRAPFVAYDAPAPSSDGLRVFDQFDMYNGSLDRYDWELQGKQELYVPYNAYRLQSDQTRHSDLLTPGHPNPEFLRYELHRVWKVVATLKEGRRHIYGKRVFYLDEDSWQILLADLYDTRGGLWRFSEGHAMNYYEVPALWTSAEIHYDLHAGRYLAMGLTNETGPYDFFSDLGPGDFTPLSLRRRVER